MAYYKLSPYYKTAFLTGLEKFKLSCQSDESLYPIWQPISKSVKIDCHLTKQLRDRRTCWNATNLNAVNQLMPFQQHLLAQETSFNSAHKRTYLKWAFAFFSLV